MPHGHSGSCTWRQPLYSSMLFQWFNPQTLKKAHSTGLPRVRRKDPSGCRTLYSLQLFGVIFGTKVPYYRLIFHSGAYKGDVRQLLSPPVLLWDQLGDLGEAGNAISSPSGVWAKPEKPRVLMLLCSQVTSTTVENRVCTVQVYHFTHFCHACKSDYSSGPGMTKYRVDRIDRRVHGTARICIKIEIHEIHQNLLNPMSINRNPLSVMKCTSIERKLIIEIQHCSSLLWIYNRPESRRR